MGKNTGLDWPDGFQAHHIISLDFGGPIEDWWNIVPIDPETHRMIHRSVEYLFARKYLKDI